MSAATADKSGRLYTIHSMGEQEIDTRVRGVAALNEKEARLLTEQIQQTTVRLWLLVTEAHDRKAHLALGYTTWVEYAKEELGMSESRSYQLLDTGHVMKALAAGGVDVLNEPPPPARVVARVKDRLTEVRKVAEKISKAGYNGDSLDVTLRTLARDSKASNRGAAAASSASGGGKTVENVIPIESGKTEKATGKQGTAATEPCPACAGTGKVTKAVAERLLAILSKL